MIKQPIPNLKLKPLHTLNASKIYCMPGHINDKDILAMFNGLLNLLKQKYAQDQTENILNLELKYNRLKYLYNKNKEKLNKLIKNKY